MMMMMMIMVANLMFAESCGPYGGAENAREIKRVFLTGGSGYLGRNLIRFFVENGVEVHAIARSEKSERIVKHLGAVPFERGSICAPLYLAGRYIWTPSHFRPVPFGCR